MDKGDECSKICDRNLEIPFPTKRIAQIAYDVLQVDKEPKRSGVKKSLHVEDSILKVEFTAGEARRLRVAVNGFLEKVDLVAGTVDLLGSPCSETYSHYQ